eukprot:Hpha_TRINITY_DN15243_c2_g10::TRINITY_DN15243_c2_g10_i2::g.65996::m.65996/K10416/DYNC1LI, DNCLI; dynein light intermediate chain 1, cytosolic
MGDREEEEEAPENLWEQVLAEHRASSQVSKDRDIYRIFFLGHRGDGKDRVLAAVTGVDEDHEGGDSFGLGFTWGDWKETPMGEDEDVRVRLLFTTIEKPQLQCLLPAYFLRPNSNLRAKWLETSVFILTVDLSQPHLAIKNLDAWYEILKKLVDEVEQAEPDLAGRTRHRQDQEFDLFHTTPQAMAKKRAAVDADLVVVQDEEEEMPREKKKLTGGRHKDIWKKMGLFEKGNIGVPIIVVGTRADELAKSAESLHRDGKEHYLNYIQSHLRKWCVARGAALLFTSAKEKGNSLREYLLFRLSKVPTSDMLDSKRMVTSQTPKGSYVNESLFIPAYADALDRIVRLPLGQFADTKFEDAVKPPAKKETSEKKEVVESYAEFLESAKQKLREGGVPVGVTDRADKAPRTGASKTLDKIRREGAGAPAAGGEKNSVESEAEKFFSKMIKTYGAGGARAPGKPSSRKTGDAAAPAAK